MSKKKIGYIILSVKIVFKYFSAYIVKETIVSIDYLRFLTKTTHLKYLLPIPKIKKKEKLNNLNRILINIQINFYFILIIIFIIQ